MSPDSEALRAILKQYIGPAYDRALRNTGSEERAREATRRAMELLKRSCEAGVEPSKALVLRITDDCCDESAFYNRQPAAQRPAAPACANDALPLAKAAPFFTEPLHSHTLAPNPAQTNAMQAEPQHAARVCAAPAKAEPKKPVPSQATPAQSPPAKPQLSPSAPLAEEEQDVFASRPRERVSPHSALLVMFLALAVVVLVIVLVVMLTSGEAAPALGKGGSFTAWFNAHIFPLF